MRRRSRWCEGAGKVDILIAILSCAASSSGHAWLLGYKGGPTGVAQQLRTQSSIHFNPDYVLARPSLARLLARLTLPDMNCVQSRLAPTSNRTTASAPQAPRSSVCCKVPYDPSLSTNRITQLEQNGYKNTTLPSSRATATGALQPRTNDYLCLAQDSHPAEFSKANVNASHKALPYQALPVTGLRKPRKSPGLPVVEPDNNVAKEELQAHIAVIMDKYTRKLDERTAHFMGYPCNLDLDYSALEHLIKYSINNAGDPWIDSNYGVNSREFEVGVLNWFARLWEIEEDDYWGYVTTGGTEGNMHGILVGRETLPDGILYASQASHYSVSKAARMYRMPENKIKTLPSGEIDYEDLRVHLMANKDRPAILNVNIGTTVKGAIDDLDKILDILKDCGFTEDRFFIHCDAALFGMMLPFLQQDAPRITFRKPIGSISISGHKFVGTPMPCGVVITREKYVTALSNDIEYINTRDATIMGSRNGHTPIYLWYTLTRKGYEGMRQDVERCMRNARLLRDMLETHGIRTMLNPLSNTVVFERPSEEAFVRKWQLACEGDIAHVVVMPHVDIEKLEAFVRDLMQSRARMALASSKQLVSVNAKVLVEQEEEEERQALERAFGGQALSAQQHRLELAFGARRECAAA